MKQAAPAGGVLATPASDVPVAALTAFATRNTADLGEGFEPPPTREAWRAVLQDSSQRWFAITDGTSVIGLVVFTRWTAAPWRYAEIGFGLDAGVVGQGVIQRTVPHLISTLLSNELARIEARVDPSNVRATRALRSLGFRFEGVARGCLDGVDGRRNQEQWAIIAADLADVDNPAHHTPPVTDGTDREAGHV